MAKVHGHMDAYLSACQLGITLASLGLGWVGEPAFADLLSPILNAMGIFSPQVVHGISFFFAFFTISFLHIVVGELAPKSMAIRMSERVAIWCAIPLYSFYHVMYPAIWVLNASSNKVLRWIGLADGHNSHDAHYSSEELKVILRTGNNADNFTQSDWKILAHSLDVGDLEVSDLMRPFSEVIALKEENSLADNLEIISLHRFSRYPFIDEEGKVLGVVHLKNLFLALQRDPNEVDWRKIMQPVVYVQPDEAVMDLFRRFKTGGPHFAVVAYKPEDPLGFITLDNVLGAMVGEIRDEFRQHHHDWSLLDDGTMIGKGSLPVFSLERALGIEIEQEDADSVGGLVMWRLGEIPKEGDRVAFDQFDIVIKKMNGPRIVLLRVYPHPKEISED